MLFWAYFDDFCQNIQREQPDCRQIILKTVCEMNEDTVYEPAYQNIDNLY